jgi:hypothetical protein
MRRADEIRVVRRVPFAPPSALHVLGMSDDFAMRRIAANAVVAEVVDLQTRRDGAVTKFVGDPDSVGLLVTAHAHDPVTSVGSAAPRPAFVRTAHVDLLVKSNVKGEPSFSSHAFPVAKTSGNASQTVGG